MPASIVGQARSHGTRSRDSMYGQHHQSRRSSVMSLGKQSVRTGVSSGRDSSMTLLDEGGNRAPVAERQVVKFVYSQAVEKAFKRTYRCSQFGPMSAKPTGPSVEIVKLPEIYSDFVKIRQMLESNHRHIEDLRARGELIREKSVAKLPKMAFRNAVSRLKQRPGAGSNSSSSSSVPKLPPLENNTNLTSKSSPDETSSSQQLLMDAEQSQD